jgi:hypothetical protein
MSPEVSDHKNTLKSLYSTPMRVPLSVMVDNILLLEHMLRKRMQRESPGLHFLASIEKEKQFHPGTQFGFLLPEISDSEVNRSNG